MSRVAACIVLLTVCGSACKGRRGDVRSEVELALTAADALYDQRVEPERLLESQQAYLAVLAESPNDPDVLWRLSRAYSAFAYGYPEAPGDPCGSPGVPAPALCYTLALEYAFQCMEANPAWSSRLAINDGNISKRVAASLGTQELPCVREAIHAWVRWAELRGPSANLYLESISWLSVRTGDLSKATPDWITGWGQGMTEVLASDAAGPDLEAAQANFELSIGLADGLATPEVDQLIHLTARDDRSGLSDAIGGLEAKYPTDVSHPWALENRRALERLKTVSEDPQN